MATVPMQVPTGSPLESYALPGGTYTQNSAGIISVAPADVAYALAAGCNFANLTSTVATSVAAAGTTVGGATALASLGGNVYPVTGSALGARGVILAAGEAITGRAVTIVNLSQYPLDIYPPTGGTINNLSANTAVTCNGNGSVTMVCTSGSGNTWASVGTPGLMLGGLAASTAAAGSTIGDGAVLPSGSFVYPTSAANGTKAVVLNASDAIPGRVIYVANPVAAVLVIYPPNASSSFNAGGAGVSFSTTSGHGVLLACLSNSAGTSIWTTLG